MKLEQSPAVEADPSIDSGHPEPTDWIDHMLKEAFEKATTPPELRLADLLDEIAFTLGRYLYFPQPATAMLLACWIAMTYCFRAFTYAGYLAIRSKIPGSGKTRLLDLLSALAKGNPPIYTSPTGPVLFRSTQDVFLIDEVDRLRGQDRQTYGQILSILNAGYESNGVVPRMDRVNDTGPFVQVDHPVYGPKAFAGLERLEPALASRCFPIQMTQAPNRLSRFSMRSFGDTATRLRKDLDSWTCSHEEEITRAYGELPDALPILRRYDDRYQDISEPLVILATLADAEYGGTQRILPVLLEGLCLASSERVPAQGDRLAVALYEILIPELGNQTARFIPSRDLLGILRAGGLSSIDSAKDLAKVLAEVGLHSRSNGALHGYEITKAWLMALKPIRQDETPL